MYENLAWKQFLNTGNLEAYIEYKKIEELNNKKRDEVINEADQIKRNSY